MQTEKRREKRSFRAIFLALIIFVIGILCISLAVAEFYVSTYIGESWAQGIWGIFAGSGLMMIPQFYAILDVTIGVIYLFCSYFVFRIKHMEFAVLTAFATGLVGLFVFGIGDWWTYVGRVTYKGLGVTYMRVLVQGAVPLVISAISLTLQREEAKTLMGRRIRGFWEEFSHNKIGLVGAAIVFAYVAAAVLVPVLSLGLSPDTTGLADNRVPPEWTTMFVPSMKYLPRSSNYYPNWSRINLDLVPEYIRSDPNFTWGLANSTVMLNFSSVVFNESDPICIVLEIDPFDYPYDPPKGGGFSISFKATIDPKSYRIVIRPDGTNYTSSANTAKYDLELNLTDPADRTLSLWDAEWENNRVTYFARGYNTSMSLNPINITSAESRLIQAKQTFTITLVTDLYWAYRMGSVSTSGATNSTGLSQTLFKEKGNYTLRYYLYIAPLIAGRPVNFYAEITPVELKIRGMVWGLMGTDHLGRDVWSRIVAGVKISLAIGLAAAVASSFLGVLVGVIAGYVGGTTDELLMRLVDILLCLPVLPLLIVLVAMYGQNVWYIVILIAVFGWQGLSRVIRSQVLSIREAAFVECATASGASRTYIMIRHLVPNVLPIVLSDFVLSVPGGIMTEAGLSFIGFGDPSTPTWGREFNIMWTEGQAFPVFAWWWIIPPAAAITLLCLAFVFLGHAVDEIVNPRLRRRR